MRPSAAAMSTADPLPPLTRFWGPRYWPTWLLLAWLRLTAALPWRAAVALHRLLGRALWHVLPARRSVVLRNLEICFPELDAADRQYLARRNFENVAISLAEIKNNSLIQSLLAPDVTINGQDALSFGIGFDAVPAGFNKI